MEMAYLELDELTKHYGAVIAADHVSLSVKQGEFLTLLGPSGSGKTTLLMMVAGFVKPDHGRMLLDGQDLTLVPPYNRGLGMVFQNYALFPHMTVFENVAFALKLRKLNSTDIRRRVAETLALVHLEEFETRFPSQLSGGQQQRVSLARALVYQPRLLLMDEPLGALDKKLREAMQIELKQIQKRVGITVVSVTHDQEEALTLSDRIAVLSDGRLKQVGSAHELYERPESRFVADFIGESNFLDVRVESVNENAFVASSRSMANIHIPIGPPVAPGERMLFSIRPEKLFFVAHDDAKLCMAHGTISEVIYMGDINKYYVDLGADETLIVKQHNREGMIQPRLGEQVTLGWDPNNSVSLKPQ